MGVALPHCQTKTSALTEIRCDGSTWVKLRPVLGRFSYGRCLRSSGLIVAGFPSEKKLDFPQPQADCQGKSQETAVKCHGFRVDVAPTTTVIIGRILSMYYNEVVTALGWPNKPSSRGMGSQHWCGEGDVNQQHSGFNVA